MPLAWCLPDRPLGGMTAPAVQGMSILSWHLLPGPVQGEKGYGIPPLTSEAWKAKKSHCDERTARTWPNAQQCARARITRESVLKQFWQSVVDDRFDLDNAIHTNSEFSYALAVMDKLKDGKTKVG